MNKNGWISRKEAQVIKDTYTKGTKIHLVSMRDDFGSRLNGLTGVVDHVDDAGQIHMNWENGSCLALIPGVDIFEIIQ